MKTKASIRDYEEIITLQDKAIEALTQANSALVTALEAIKRARAEHGFQPSLPGLGDQTIPNTFPSIPFQQPYTIWGGGVGQVTGITTGQWNNGTQFLQGLQARTITAQNLMAQAGKKKKRR